MQEMQQFEIVISDGGREAAGYSGDAGDCVTRAIANATGLDYEEVRTDLMRETDEFRKTRRSRAAKAKKSNSVRNGTNRDVAKSYIKSLGWQWVPTMGIGTGCTVHLRPEELPTDRGPLIVSVSKHLTCVKGGEIWDTYDCTREGTRCVYGYWHKANKTETRRSSYERLRKERYHG